MCARARLHSSSDVSEGPRPRCTRAGRLALPPCASHFPSPRGLSARVDHNKPIHARPAGCDRLSPAGRRPGRRLGALDGEGAERRRVPVGGARLLCRTKRAAFTPSDPRIRIAAKSRRGGRGGPRPPEPWRLPLGGGALEHGIRNGAPLTRPRFVQKRVQQILVANRLAGSPSGVLCPQQGNNNARAARRPVRRVSCRRSWRDVGGVAGQVQETDAPWVLAGQAPAAPSRSRPCLLPLRCATSRDFRVLPPAGRDDDHFPDAEHVHVGRQRVG